MIRWLLAAFLVAILPMRAGWAAEEPDVVKKEVADVEQDCRNDGGTPHRGPNFLRVQDLNGDGGEDWVIDYKRFECRGSSSPQPMCGSGGCSLSVYMWSGGSTWTQALDTTVQAYRWIAANGRPALQLDMGGSACGKANYQTCREVYVFQGTKLVPARKRRG
jgi:hypothetical protein